MQGCRSYPPRTIADATGGGAAAAGGRQKAARLGAEPVPAGGDQPRGSRRLAQAFRRPQQGALDAKTRERIALAVAEVNGCACAASGHIRSSAAGS
ncbi:MAG: carboxymuconolactone decarboxylase family protein [Geminicoccaceae bacterium]